MKACRRYARLVALGGALAEPKVKKIKRPLTSAQWYGEEWEVGAEEELNVELEMMNDE
ncbi:hypothetical protein [Algoriphagus boritolerans]|uniref:hypothetical protein n=1 Tax=Algoriphagus boritolerans TaxID=308111 RepID=UPI001359D6B2|nr:hypothetical protein [Algoriphagus boritolerans]